MKRASYPADSLAAWLHLNEVVANGVTFQKAGSVDADSDKGNAIVATESWVSNESDAEPTILLRVPADLILSLETVHDHAKSDHHLREVLEAAGGFGTTTRGAILIFLLLQITHSSPDIPQTIGVSSPWADYVKFFPGRFPLPTFYSDEEISLLKGTSLESPLASKVAALQREFEHLRQATESIPWCRQCWWDEDTGKLTLHDWLYVDAAYRSRMLDLPGIGHAMVPCIDMANHAGEKKAKALYDMDAAGRVILQLRWGQSVHQGEEVTISYGDEKSASEMFFTYGFLPDDLSDAKQVMLDMTFPDDDPLAVAKNMLCHKDPGVKIVAREDEDQASGSAPQIYWESQILWWASVNEEDGLHIGVAQRMDGTKELEATWKDKKIESPGQLQEFLASDPSWDIFQLRAVVLLLDQVETLLASSHQFDNIMDRIHDDEILTGMHVRPGIITEIFKLRELEEILMQRAVQTLTSQRASLLESPAVVSYLTQLQSAVEDVEDFS
ncbi:hypothetical protein PDE_00199 [Penicillium oxalicum 114-2]|uniref:SET domain-containing protein n=1 Tax=Penicillium oxalicum (strain 114-2 / CGMCC 5302) TaxID=933388 RepID=S7Z9B3_PENO1|nr:hypothetical protein PDE_00199 [Penicillium oxalicum 114-2]